MEYKPDDGMYVILIHLKHFKMSDREEEEEEKEEEEDVPVVIYTVKSRPIVYIYRHHPMHAFSNSAYLLLFNLHGDNNCLVYTSLNSYLLCSLALLHEVFMYNTLHH